MSKEEKYLIVAQSTVADSYEDMKAKLIQVINSPDVWVRSWKVERIERHPTHNRYKITFDFVGVLDEVDMNNDSKAVVPKEIVEEIESSNTHLIAADAYEGNDD